MPPSESSERALPSPAAAVVLLRPGVDGAEVLLIRRHRSASFFAGSSTFPGGRVEPEDGLDGDDPTAQPTPEAFIRAAIRELREETGYALDSDGTGSGAPIPLARWVTPEVLPRRFDTVFVAASAPQGQSGQADPVETEGFVWIRPLDALAQHHAGKDLSLPPPALSMLGEIARDLAANGDPSPNAIGAALNDWARRGIGATVIPTLEIGANGEPVLVLPNDPTRSGTIPKRLLLRGDRFVLPGSD